MLTIYNVCAPSIVNALHDGEIHMVFSQASCHLLVSMSTHMEMRECHAESLVPQEGEVNMFNSWWLVDQ